MAGRKRLTVTRENGYIRAVLPDAIGMDDSVAIELEIRAFLSPENNNLVLDLSKTTALYSSGIGLFIRLQRLAKELNSSLSMVNISKKMREIIKNLNLDKVFNVYSTDVEFEISKENVWEKKCSQEGNPFLFVVQIEDGLYRLTFSGQMTSLHDLSAISEFRPDPTVTVLVLDLENLEVIDTYGAQVFIDFIEHIQHIGKKSVIYGANQIVRDLFDLFPTTQPCNFYDSEQEALNHI
jgi:anti-anti-sigma regulatory factor